MVNIIRKDIRGAIEFLEGKTIFCFGCGIQGKRVIYYLKDWGLSENTIAFIDNNVDKIGGKIEFLGCEYKILSLKEAVDYIEGNQVCESVVFLVTALHFTQIYQQIEREYPDKNFMCMSMDEIASEQFKVSDYNGVIKQYSNPVIPKIIHYAWFGGEKPDSIKKNIDGWHEMCPDFEIKEWNESNYDISKNRYMQEAYDVKKWGFVPDYLRLDVIFKYGGIYLDTDIAIVKKLDDLLFQDAFGCIDSSLTMNLGSGFGAKQHCQMIKLLRDYYDSVSFVRDDGTIDNTTCNTHQLVLLSQYGFSITDSIQCINGMNIYPIVFQGANCHGREYAVKNNTYWIHYGNMSWME